MNLSFNPILFPANVTKTSIKDLAENLVDDLLDGNNDPVKIADTMAKAEFFIKEVRSDNRYVESVVESVEKRGEKNRLTLENGTKIEKVETGVDYDYSNCGDKVWTELNAEKIRITTLLKEREEFLKNVPTKGLPTHDKETGEAYTIYPPAKSSKTSFKVTLLSK